MNVYIIDNYDSFTYNLYQMIGEILQSEKNKGRLHDFEIIVKRNNEITIEDIIHAQPDRIIISPGPGSPEDIEYFGICNQVITTLGQSIPTLGVCLGMQGIVHAFGGRIIRAPLPMHGKTSLLHHDATALFKHIPNGLEIMRYHSLMAELASFPDCLKVTAITGKSLDFSAPFDENMLQEITSAYEIMGVQHREYPLYGVQFHPESFLSEGGKDLFKNFLMSE